MADLIIPKIWEGKEICMCVTEERAVFVYDKEQDKFIDTGKTAIELPLHGRLGDLDLVEEWMRKKHKGNDCPFDIDAFLFALRKIPTVVEASE